MSTTNKGTQMITLEAKYKNLTPLEKFVYDEFHNEVIESGRDQLTDIGVDQIANESYSVNKIKGGLGSLIKKGLMTSEGINGNGFEEYAINLKLTNNQ